VRELGTLETPTVLTNTLAVPTAAEALIEYTLRQNPGVVSVNPVVAECNDGGLNDIAGRHLTREHVLEAIEEAKGGPVAEGNVGAGTGMSAFGFKAGIGTASRVVANEHGGYTVGVLVLANAGSLPHLRIGGFPVGARLARKHPSEDTEEKGSIIAVLGTDAPVLQRQLGRLARRVVHGLARVGLTSGSGSGDFVIAFTTANRVQASARAVSRQLEELNAAHISPLFEAVIEAAEEAYLNAILRCETMAGCDGLVRRAVPVDRLRAIIACWRGAGRAGNLE